MQLNWSKAMQSNHTIPILQHYLRYTRVFWMAVKFKYPQSKQNSSLFIAKDCPISPNIIKPLFLHMHSPFPLKWLLDDVNDITMTSWWCNVLILWCDLLSLYPCFLHYDFSPWILDIGSQTHKYITALLPLRPTIIQKYITLCNDIGRSWFI